MSDHWSVMTACNHYRNGMFQGHTDRAEFLGPDGDQALSLWLGGNLKFDDNEGLITFGRPEKDRRFRYTRSSQWHGNWCWNRYWLEDRECARLMRLLARDGQPESGWSRLWDVIKRGDRITAELLNVLAERKA